MNEKGEQVFFAAEMRGGVCGACARQLCGSLRNFEMTLTGQFSRRVLHFFIEPGKSDMANQSSFDRGHKSDYPVNSVVMLHSVSNAAFLMHRKAFGESPLYIARGLRFVVSILVSETVSPSYNTMCHMI